MRTTEIRRPAVLAFAALALAACGGHRYTTVESGGEIERPVRPINGTFVPTGTTLEVKLDQTLGTKQSKVGDAFTATVQSTLTAQNGEIVVPAGAKVEGRVTALDDSDHAGDQALIRLDFDRITMNGQSYDLDASIVRAMPQESGRDSRTETIGKAAAGAVAGGIIGAVIGDRDAKNIALGALAGAAAGTALSLGFGDVEPVLPAGSTMTLRVSQAVTLR